MQKDGHQIFYDTSVYTGYNMKQYTFEALQLSGIRNHLFNYFHSENVLPLTIFSPFDNQNYLLVTCSTTDSSSTPVDSTSTPVASTNAPTASTSGSADVTSTLGVTTSTPAVTASTATTTTGNSTAPEGGGKGAASALLLSYVVFVLTVIGTHVMVSVDF